MNFLIPLAALFSAIGNLIMKVSSSSSAKVGYIYFIFGASSYFLSLLIFKEGLKVMPLSIAYPILASLSIILSCIFANKFLQENLALINILGIFFCCLGIGLLSYQSKLS